MEEELVLERRSDGPEDLANDEVEDNEPPPNAAEEEDTKNLAYSLESTSRRGRRVQAPARMKLAQAAEKKKVKWLDLVGVDSKNI